MSISNYKVIGIICAVFLLLIGTPFFVAGEAANTAAYTGEFQVMVDYSNGIYDMNEAHSDGYIGSVGLFNPMAVWNLTKNQKNFKTISSNLLIFYLPGIFLLMNKMFFHTERYISYNCVKGFLIELKILHRADGKYRDFVSCV